MFFLELQTFDGGGDEAGAVPDESGCDVLRLAAERLVQRSHSVGVRRVDVGAVRDQELQGPNSIERKMRLSQ